MVLSLVFCVFLVSSVQCRVEYLQRIPNAYSVKTEDGVRWLAVGHTDRTGEKPERNVFGRDFQHHGLRWSVSLCEADSDGDGMTNGEELGDPQCIWSPGNNPTRTTNITHPGICEPKTNPKCQVNNTVDCGESSEECEPGTMTTAKPEVQNDEDNDENTVNLEGTAGSSNEKSNNWTKETTVLVAFGAIALLILVAVVIKVILHFVKKTFCKC